MKPAHAPAARAFCAMALVTFVLLGAAWAVDRAHRFETPRFEETFVTIRGETPGVGSERATWLMPINPGCPSCMRRAKDLSGARLRGIRIVFLIVDQRRPPAPLAIAELEADGVWWDARGVWRARWGHRVYGEILRFAPRGRYLGTTPPRFAPGSEGGEEG